MPSPFTDISLQSPLGPVIAEGRVLDAVAGRDLCGTLDDIAEGLGISYSDLRAAIDELVRIGWVTLELLAEGLVLSLPEDARVAS
jgi:DNA-binding MarR family transcriptional regulator